MTISEIRNILKQETVEKTVLEEIMADERKGVRQLVDAYIRRLNREGRTVPCGRYVRTGKFFLQKRIGVCCRN